MGRNKTRISCPSAWRNSQPTNQARIWHVYEKETRPCITSFTKFMQQQVCVPWMITSHILTKHMPWLALLVLRSIVSFFPVLCIVFHSSHPSPHLNSDEELWAFVPLIVLFTNYSSFEHWNWIVFHLLPILMARHHQSKTMQQKFLLNWPIDCSELPFAACCQR